MKKDVEVPLSDDALVQKKEIRHQQDASLSCASIIALLVTILVITIIVARQNW